MPFSLLSEFLLLSLCTFYSLSPLIIALTSCSSEDGDHGVLKVYNSVPPHQTGLALGLRRKCGHLSLLGLTAGRPSGAGMEWAQVVYYLSA